jgi:hypothetical protein
MWIERSYIAKVSEAVSARPVVLLTGIRQAGKSSMLRKYFNDAEYVTLDKLAFAEEAVSNPSRFLNRFNKQVIIDEVQYAPQIFRDLKILVDENRDLNGKWILTGSQQFTLMKGVKESLAGRVRVLNLGTLCVNELNNAQLLNERRDFIWKGGFPEVWSKNLNVSDFFEDYIQTYLERDLRDILNVLNLRDFRRFLSLLAYRTGQILNYSELSKDIGVAVNTVKSWISALEVSGIVILLPPYYNNLGKRMIKAPKIYFCDTGLVSSLMTIDSLQALDRSQYSGNLWENLVFTEFMKEGYTPGRNLFYYRDQNGVEVDFVVEHGGEVTLVEAKESERPDRKKLSFQKVAPLFKTKVNCVVACGIEEQGLLKHENFSVYNPLYGFNPLTF